MPGMLTHDEVDCLYRLAQLNHCGGVIVEIGSWQGKSTIALTLGAANAYREKICAIDPHGVQGNLYRCAEEPVSMVRNPWVARC